MQTPPNSFSFSFSNYTYVQTHTVLKDPPLLYIGIVLKNKHVIDEASEFL